MVGLANRTARMWLIINNLKQKPQKTPLLEAAFAIFPVFYV